MHLGFLRLSAFAVFLLVSSDVADSARGVLRGWSTRLEREAQEVLDSSDPWRNPLHSGAAPPWFRDMPPAALASIAQAKRKAAEEKKKTALKEFQSSLSVEVAAQAKNSADDEAEPEKAAEDPNLAGVGSKCLTRCSGSKHNRHCETICDQLSEETGLFSPAFKPQELKIQFTEE